MTKLRHVHRARLYKLASLAFDRPDDELEDALLSGTFEKQLLESAGALDNEALEEHAAAVAEASPTDADEFDEYYSNWSALFGFEAGGNIQQYQIEYSPGTIVTSTDTLADLSGFYKAFGLSMEDGNRERADHLCIQLEFLSHLALQTAYLENEDDDTGVEVVTDAQGSFLEDHLGRWTGRFRETLAEEADVEFYRALAALVDSLVADDTDRFGVEPKKFEETPPSPLDGLNEGEGDFRCGTCGTTPSGSTPSGPSAEMPMGNREGPY
ncbi:molecular chaperone TorD family protein [Natronococcus sp. A-GB7]|uniref:TorD/DmsD family molecular chaperone n=1 Tax=Natronococcus sp. A-GB7 TaxID=3037649 RepID=UPI00241D9F20|nr:molecular chaperone TorD family protein [Natronococcus sp. A-GB7]MDG5817248.1 molecular chaperone TorD family protein [Natronococcus sp. A-GB7]